MSERIGGDWLGATAAQEQDGVTRRSGGGGTHTTNFAGDGSSAGGGGKQRKEENNGGTVLADKDGRFKKEYARCMATAGGGQAGHNGARRQAGAALR